MDDEGLYDQDQIKQRRNEDVQDRVAIPKGEVFESPMRLNRKNSFVSCWAVSPDSGFLSEAHPA